MSKHHHGKQEDGTLSRSPRITEVEPGVFFVQGTSSNWTIVLDQEGDTAARRGFTLVDSGYAGDYPLLLESLSSLDLHPTECVALLVTHGHVDHIGAAQKLSAEHGVPVWCHELESGNLVGPKREQLSLLQVLPRLISPRVRHWLRQALRLGALEKVSITPARTFLDGERLAVPGEPTVVHCPGHTAGSSAFLFERSVGGVLATGDALVTGHELLDSPGTAQLLPGFFTADQTNALLSFAALRKRSPALILPGHGEPLRATLSS
ncbi:MBL fold metallo-hydrolase [Arthrobacter sp. NPDC090010]|uniref:MBL fold metallo-hydrolase n=1 Tax=Arthrobacter sp. NPDC090010 TaxID=3363942 RepID=UPI003818F0F7